MSIKETVCGRSFYHGAEYIATILCACQCVWLKRVLEKLGVEDNDYV